MNLTFKINGVFALPELDGRPDVVVRVRWTVIANEGSLESRGAGETLLSTGDFENFTPAAQITEQQLVQWVISTEGGQRFLDTLTAIHTTQLRKKILEANAIQLEYPFVEPPPAPAPRPQFSVMNPVEIT